MGSCWGEGCSASFGWASPRTLPAAGARPAMHLNLPRSNFSMQRGLGSGPPGAAVSFAASFCQEREWTFLALLWRWPDCEIPQPGSEISAALPFSRTLLASPPSPGVVPRSLEPPGAEGRCCELCVWFGVLLWDPSSPRSHPQPLDASQSIQFLLPGSTRCLQGRRRGTRR